MSNFLRICGVYVMYILVGTFVHIYMSIKTLPIYYKRFITGKDDILPGIGGYQLPFQEIRLVVTR